MARCRIYLFTYRRNDLLRRSVKSILDQTFTDWICEVHNDDPADTFPAEYIKELNDPRFLIKDHKQNMGAVSSFNLAFAGCNEEYVSLLEDDNWWENNFLEEMTTYLDLHPDIKVAFCNMALWRQTNQNNWEYTGKNNFAEQTGVTVFTWPQVKQIAGALHSNSALLIRNRNIADHALPGITLLNAIELVRERSFPHPIALLNKPLANFAITLHTNRNDNRWDWMVYQTMLIASYIETSPNPELAMKNGLAGHRQKRFSVIPNYFLANLLILKQAKLYRLLTLADWVVITRWLLKNGTGIKYCKHYLTEQRAVYEYLVANTRQRFNGSVNSKCS